jgi:hypothetical protein
MLLRRLEHSLRNLFDYFFRTLLEFYASGSNYQAVTGHIVVLDDAGEQARTALSKLNELSERAHQGRQNSAKHSECSVSVASLE